ncbi:hypothetical protein PENPOL_c028G02950 [Penicillium polonicum]|uniref:Uncharacterized protein n=1 Tax=Penicillium polonicum TaxID=60169 RepID=A0A1V6N5V8_PENPO|nr:hypothetical protein PENPOL_c028G02950 [Penicillium polonicum]
MFSSSSSFVKPKIPEPVPIPTNDNIASWPTALRYILKTYDTLKSCEAPLAPSGLVSLVTCFVSSRYSSSAFEPYINTAPSVHIAYQRLYPFAVHTYNTMLEKFHNFSLRARPKYQYREKAETSIFYCIVGSSASANKRDSIRSARSILA